MDSTKKHLEEALKEAELNIANYVPPSSNSNSTSGDSGVDIQKIKEEFAAKSANELATALFDSLTKMIQEGVKKELDTQQLNQKVSSLQAEVAAMQEILRRNSLS
jgi:hypothetical protein